jgi:hypothetical protein
MAEELLEVSHALAFGSAWRLGGGQTQAPLVAGGHRRTMIVRRCAR